MREHLYYSDDLVYLVKTIDSKGHKHRVMIVTHRHTTEPTFEEYARAYTVLYDYMKKLSLQEWYIVDSTFCRWHDHWHKIACDSLGTREELELLDKTPKVKYPLEDFSYYPGQVMIGIPAHNEEEHIAKVVKSSLKYGDVVVYNDRSTDDTAKIAYELGVKILVDPSDQGYGFALNRLFKHARSNYDVLITLDGDGQHNPDEIPRFLMGLQHSDVVLGNRFLGKTDIPKHRKAIIKIVNRVYSVGDAQCGFRAYSKKALKEIEIKDRGMGASLEILNKVVENNLGIIEVPVTISYENTEHTESPFKHGMNLLESLFWGTLWRRPYTYLGIPCFISFSLSLLFGGNLIYFYTRSRDFVISYALLTIGFLMFSIALGISTFFITVQRRLLRELS